MQTQHVLNVGGPWHAEQELVHRGSYLNTEILRFAQNDSLGAPTIETIGLSATGTSPHRSPRFCYDGGSDRSDERFLALRPRRVSTRCRP